MDHVHRWCPGFLAGKGQSRALGGSGHLPLTPCYATEESVAGPSVLLAGSGRGLPELSMGGIVEPAPSWARAFRRAPGKSPAAVGRVQAWERVELTCT